MFVVCSLFFSTISIVSAAVDSEGIIDPSDPVYDDSIDVSPPVASGAATSSGVSNTASDIVSSTSDFLSEESVLGLTWLIFGLIAFGVVIFLLIVILVIRRMLRKKHVTKTSTATLTPVPSAPKAPASSPQPTSKPTAPSVPQAPQQPTPQPTPPTQQPKQQPTPQPKTSSASAPQPSQQSVVSPVPQQSAVTPSPAVSAPVSQQPPAAQQSVQGSNPNNVQFVKYYAQNLSHDPRIRIKYLLSAGDKFVSSGDMPSAKIIYSYIFEDYHHLSYHDDTLYNQIVQFKQKLV